MYRLKQERDIYEDHALQHIFLGYLDRVNVIFRMKIVKFLVELTDVWAKSRRSHVQCFLFTKLALCYRLKGPVLPFDIQTTTFVITDLSTCEE